MSDMPLIVIPSSIENLHLPSPELVSYYKDLEQRVLWVDFPIDDPLFEIVKWILHFNREDKSIPKEERKPIYVLINSPGGDLYATFSCMDVMLASETPIVTVNMGMAMSGGFLLLLAGEKRYALNHSTAMYHNGDAGFHGNSEQVMMATKHYNKQLEQMKKYIMERTTMKPATYNKYKNADGWLDSAEQLKHGVIDEVITSVTDIIK